MLSIQEILNATNGNLLSGSKDEVIKEYEIDSRKVNENMFFIPIVGEKVDAHTYILDVVSQGAVGFFIESNYEKKDEVIKKSLDINNKLCIIEIKNSVKALHDIAKFNREKHLNIPLIAVTGSVGKTSTKEIISSVLETEYTVLKTEKNFNSEIGLPLMLLKLENQDVAVLEHGISNIGEMKYLVEASKPNMAVITNIGTSHIEFLKTKKNIYKEKLDIAKGMDGKLFVNGDDELLKETKISNTDTYSISEASKIIYSKLGVEFDCNIYGELSTITINQYGKHNIYNSIVAIRIGEIFNITKNNILKGIANYKNYDRRFEVINLENGITLIDDTYNASFDSMKSGLDTLNMMRDCYKIAILGDMLELGEYSKSSHENVGLLFSNYNINELLTFGDRSLDIYNKASKYINAKHFELKEDIVKYLKKLEKKNLVIYFKASNGMKFNEIIEKLK